MKNKIIFILIGLGLTIIFFIVYLNYSKIWFSFQSDPEELLKFNENKSITYDNFEGSIGDTSAMYSHGEYGIYFKYSCEGKLKYRIFSYMVPKSSWVQDQSRNSTLRIQRIKFKCFELFARKLKDTLAMTPNICNMNVSVLNSLGDKNHKNLLGYVDAMFSDLTQSNLDSLLDIREPKLDSLLLNYSKYKNPEN